MQRTALLISAFFILTAIAGIFFISSRSASEPTSFNDCKTKGYNVKGSYPAICESPSGKSFIEEN